MTKFEDEFKALTSWDWINIDLIQQILTRFRNWHSDEEFQEKATKLTFAEEEIQELGDKIGQLESQLQQQALPVVPECVGIWIKKCQELNWMITDVLAPESWSSDFAKDTENWLKKSKENFNLLALAFITGKYQVEKPQLFYLREKNTGYYLRKKGNNEYGITPHYSNDYDEKYMHYKFTQKEIDKLDTGSYELVPVEDGE
jgi:hypothetical protein